MTKVSDTSYSEEALKLKKLSLVMRAVDSNMGIYPQAMQGYCDERDYKQRDGYKNGWNACVMEYGKEFRKAIAESQTVSAAESVFLQSNVFEYQDGAWLVFLNDTWYYASADAEEIPKEKENEVADWFTKHGAEGVMYWVYLQRGHYPDIPSTAAQVRTIASVI